MCGKSVFLCGTAKTDITPPEHLIPDLYGLMMIPYAGVIDRLHLRVLAFSDGTNRALIIAFDLDKAPNPKKWLPVLVKQTGIPEENITYIGTHTHSAPLTTVRSREDAKRSPSEQQMRARLAYEAFLLQKLSEAVETAIAGMVPAELGYGRGSSYINVSRNREFSCETEKGGVVSYISQGVNPDREADRTVHVIEVRTEDARPAAFLVNYAVHCDVMFRNRYREDGRMGISADLAGAVSCALEERFPGCVAVWSSGAAGDINPVVTNEIFYEDPRSGRNTVELMGDCGTLEQMMRALAAHHLDDVMRIIRGISDFSCVVPIRGALEWSETPGAQVQRTAAGGFEVTGGSASPYRIRLHLLRLGNTALYGIGGELYSSLGRQLQQQAPLANTVILNHDASLIDDAGYIMDDETLERIDLDARLCSPGMVPGGRTPARKGCVADSLQRHTRSLFEKVM